MFDFRNKTIFVFSPQPWNYLQISKHHYARALAKDNEVYFVTPPANAILSNFTIENERKGLYVVRYTIPSPWFLRAKFPAFYKFLLRYFLSRLLRRNIPKADIVFDFGCYRLFDSLDFVTAGYKIFFPVDDFATLQPDERGSDIVLTVSENIQRKFPEGKCHFINHGLADSFVARAQKRSNMDLIAQRQAGVGKSLRVGYSGNIFIPFLDREVMKRCLEEHRDLVFHFFGSSHPLNGNDQEWYDFLKRQENVVLEGQKETASLAESLESMDILLVCYKPDYKNYHGENTHKMLEYLSTGRLVVSTHISYYQQFDFLMMTEKDQNDGIVSMLAVVKDNQSLLYNAARIRRQVRFALANSYDNRCQDIFELIGY